VVEAHQAGDIQANRVVSIAPGLVFDRLWQKRGLEGIITRMTIGDLGNTGFLSHYVAINRHRSIEEM